MLYRNHLLFLIILIILLHLHHHLLNYNYDRVIFLGDYFDDFNDINYWLEQWCLFYQNISKNYQSNNNCFFIIYEELNNVNYIKKLLEKINFDEIDNINLNYFKNSNKKKIDIDCANNTYKNAKDIYIEFKNKFIYKNSFINDCKKT